MRTNCAMCACACSGWLHPLRRGETSVYPANRLPPRYSIQLIYCHVFLSCSWQLIYCHVFFPVSWQLICCHMFLSSFLAADLLSRVPFLFPGSRYGHELILQSWLKTANLTTFDIQSFRKSQSLIQYEINHI